MIRSLRLRFIFGAMLALAILLVILISGITVAGYIGMENSADDLLDRMTDGPGIPRPDQPAMHEQPARPAFGYLLPEHASFDGHYILTLDPDGVLKDVQTRGIWESDVDVLQSIADSVLSAGSDHGKISGYKYRLMHVEGETQLYLLDRSSQAKMLLDTLRTSCIAAFFILIGMFIILLPLSDRLIRSYAAHIEKQRRFITDASHELKTPLAIIRANADALELIQGQSKWSRNILGQTERLSSLLQQLLLMARMDEQSFHLPTERMNFGALLQEAAAEYTELFSEKSIRFRITLNTTGTIHANRELLEQLAHILLDNAARYTSEEGHVDMLLERRSHGVRLCLSNTVSHLPECPPDALFERFYRPDAARTQSTGGCGIGLSAAQSIVQLHRGRINAAYIDGHIVRFSIDLPI